MFFEHESLYERHGLRFIKCGHIPSKADNDQQHQWVETELKPVIEAAQKEQVHLFFCDAAHFDYNHFFVRWGVPFVFLSKLLLAGIA